MDEINLRRFDMKRIQKDSVVVFVAPRRSGKSFLIRDLLAHHQTIPMGVVVSKTDKMAHYYDKFIPPAFIYEEYEPEILDKVFDRQKKAIDQGWNNPYCFVIFDDTLSDADSWKKDKRIKEIFYNGRHYKLLFLLTMQTPLGIPPGMRSNIDFTFILRAPNMKMRKDLYENYCGMFPSREIFDKVLDACTEDYGCLVVDNTTKSNKLEDQVFYYKASEHDDFRMCSQAIWDSTRASEKSKSTQEGTSYNLKSKNKKLTIRKIKK